MKKMKKKGFTLIELLAVIVVLAIIAVIATPMVLNTIEDARKGSAKSSGYTYISEVETSLAKYMLKNVETGYAAGKYDVSTLTTDLSISIKGDTPTEGNICIGSNGTITKASLKINGYVVNYDGKETTTTDLEEVEDIPCEIVLVGEPIIDKAKALVYDDTGTCKTDDTTYTYMGGCYIKGTSSSNYVWYNGFMWRIMGINSDGTVRLITEDNATMLGYGPAIVYGASETGFTYETNEGYIHDWLNEYFYERLNSTKSIIQEGAYFCSETTNGTSLTEGRTECTSGSEVTTKVGIISIDEYLLSKQSSSYLNIGQYFWTITPYDDTHVWAVNYSNYHQKTVPNGRYGVRPVINVDSKAIVTAGEGTTDNFYVLGENKTSSITGTISEKATSGEYVNLEGKTYRVVSKNSEGVKLILDGFYEETEGTTYGITGYTYYFATSGIGKKLNGDVLAWLGLDNSDKIVTSTFYQGDGVSTNVSGVVGELTYMNFLKQSVGTEVKVGLIQVGDILASQSSTMLTKNYTTTSSRSNISAYYAINRSATITTLHSWSIEYNGNVSEYEGGPRSLRPVIVVRNDLSITGGTGTWNNPYEI